MKWNTESLLTMFHLIWLDLPEWGSYGTGHENRSYSNQGQKITLKICFRTITKPDGLGLISWHLSAHLYSTTKSIVIVSISFFSRERRFIYNFLHTTEKRTEYYIVCAYLYCNQRLQEMLWLCGFHIASVKMSSRRLLFIGMAHIWHVQSVKNMLLKKCCRRKLMKNCWHILTDQTMVWKVSKWNWNKAEGFVCWWHIIDTYD